MIGKKTAILGIVFAFFVMAIPTVYGNVVIPRGGTITDQNFASGSCIQTTVGGLLAATGSPCGTGGSSYTFSAPLANEAGTVTCPTCIVSSPTAQTMLGELSIQPRAANATLQMSSANGYASNIAMDSSNSYTYISMSDDARAIPTLANIGLIIAKTPNGNCGGPGIAHINFITVGNNSHPGGGITFHTSDDSGSCVDAENLVLTHDHHVYMPQDQFYYQGRTPSTCTAFVPCGTVTWTFTTPFHNTRGGPSEPECTSGMIRDDNSTARSWVLNIQAISATSVAYNYTSLNGIGSATTIEVWAECHPASY